MPFVVIRKRPHYIKQQKLGYGRRRKAFGIKYTLMTKIG